LSNSLYSSTFNFTTIIQAPPTPLLSSPTDGSSGQPTSLALQWSPATRTDKYHLRVTTDTTTNSFTINDSAITATEFVNTCETNIFMS
jgi:hypothetical protein